jgi:hypothetical protein
MLGGNQMFNLSTQGVDVDSLVAEKRQGAIEAQKSSYGANKEYAKALNIKFEFDWFEVSHTDSSDEGKAVRKEKELFFTGLKEIGHSNPSKVWKDVRGYGQENRYGVADVSTEEGADGEVAEGGDAKHNRSPELRNLEELTTLYKFNRRQESLSPKLTKVQQKIAEALAEMGVDIGMIGD